MLTTLKWQEKKATVARMSKRLGEVLDLDEHLPPDKNVYLGCGQQNVRIPDTCLSDKQDLYKSLLADDVHTTNGLSPPANTDPAKWGVTQGSNASKAGATSRSLRARKTLRHINTI